MEDGLELQSIPRSNEAYKSAYNSTTQLTNAGPLEDGTSTGQPITSPEMSLARVAVIIATLAGVTTASSMTTGLLAVALPKMAEDLDLSDALLLWPASIYGLTSGCSLLIAGAVADVLGSRVVYLVGCFFLTAFMLGSGLAQTPLQLLVFRGFQGVAVSLCLPTAMSLLTTYLEKGRRRNAGFAFVGAGQPLGYSIGMFVGGFFVDSVGWRWGWYLSSMMAFVVLIAGIFGLPRSKPARAPGASIRGALIKEVDWVGGVIASVCLGLLSYVLAVTASSTSNITEPTQVVLLSIAGACFPLFGWWMHIQTKSGRPALIPNSLWRRLAFSSICVMVFLTWAVVPTVEFFLSLFFQKVQGLTAVETSIRFIPNVLIGIILSVCLGMILHRASAYWIILSSCFCTAIAPMLMAVSQPNWSYWFTSFWAVLLSSIAGDILFVISAIVIASGFPSHTQALASAVFNTVSQFGTAVGLAIMAVISSTVTQHSSLAAKTSPSALFEGYRASFWACFGSMVLACGIGAFGLRGVSKMGLKSD